MRSLQNLLQCLWHATKIPSSSFWHLLYNNHQWKISNWSEIISWCIFAQSRLYAFLKKQFPEITTIACRTIIPCVCVLKVCIELLFVAIFTSTFIFSMSKSSHTYRNINISNLRMSHILSLETSVPESQAPPRERICILQTVSLPYNLPTTQCHTFFDSVAFLGSLPLHSSSLHLSSWTFRYRIEYRGSGCWFGP